MRRAVSIVVLGLLLLFGLTLLPPLVLKLRQTSFRVGCANHLRILANFNDRLIPSGTVANAALTPEKRLSWLVSVLPRLPEDGVRGQDLAGRIEAALPWDAPGNAAVARTRIVTFLCPAKPPPADSERPALTQYVGLAGLGLDAAELSGPDLPPRAGCFRYGAPTPLTAITDGLSNTLLLGETDRNLGPWLRGGPATVRGLDPEDTPYLGPGDPFGGNHPDGANFALADGSVRFFSNAIEPAVFRALLTIHGRDLDMVK